MKIYRILPEDQAVALAEKVSTAEWAQGKARTEEETGTTKRNSEILKHPLLESIGRRIVNHPGISIDCIPLKCHSPKFTRYQQGERYERHTDAPWMGSTRTDLACTLFLSDEYSGGDLEAEGVTVKGKPGEAIVYECGNVHRVTPVTEGERVCVITWIQSRIRDAGKRALVGEYRRFVEKLKDQPELYLEAGRFNSALLRRWSE